MDENSWKRVAGIAAIGSSALFVALTALAITSYPGYSMSGNYLSDLGIGEKSAVFFNTAAIITGFAVIYFAYALGKTRYGKPFLASRASLAAAGLSLAGVGLFTENDLAAHIIAAGGFFLLAAGACAFAGIKWLDEGKNRIIGFSALVAAALLVFFVVASLFWETQLWQKVAVGSLLTGFSVLGIGLATGKDER